MPLLTSKVVPAHQEIDEKVQKKTGKLYAMLLHTFFKKFGGHRFPKIEGFETYMQERELTEFAFMPSGSILIYISHEWVGTDHVDPRGVQLKHLVLLLERLHKGEVDRTDMDVFHSLLYKQTHTTTAEDWKDILDPHTTYIFYDGFCMPKEEREEGFRTIPEFVKRCDFMIILAPGCMHFDKTERRTGRKMNMCYRTYVVFEHLNITFITHSYLTI